MKKHTILFLILFALLFVGQASAQKNDIPTADSVIVDPDAPVMVVDGVAYIPDTALVVIPEIPAVKPFEIEKTFKPNPRRATWYAVVCPGLGQIYNRKYWKLPIIYGGFVGLAYGINWNNQYYKDYKNAYRDFTDRDDATNSFLNMLPAGSDPNNINQEWFRSTLNQKKDMYRRYRDLCIIGMVGVYALSILDAFVDAQLFDFDISQDLTLNVMPQIQPTKYDSSVGVYCRLNF